MIKLSRRNLQKRHMIVSEVSSAKGAKQEEKETQVEKEVLE